MFPLVRNVIVRILQDPPNLIPLHVAANGILYTTHNSTKTTLISTGGSRCYISAEQMVPTWADKPCVPAGGPGLAQNL